MSARFSKRRRSALTRTLTGLGLGVVLGCSSPLPSRAQQAGANVNVLPIVLGDGTEAGAKLAALKGDLFLQRQWWISSPPPHGSTSFWSSPTGAS